MAVKAAVVDAARPPDPLNESSQAPSSGPSSFLETTFRRGTGPPRASRRLIRYSTSGDFGPGW